MIIGRAQSVGNRRLQKTGAVGVQSLRRGGFTLLEVVLSAGLTIVLLAALWGLISTYVRAFDKAEQKTQTAQVARTILAQVAEDLRSAASMASRSPGQERIAMAGQDAPPPIAPANGVAPASASSPSPPTTPPSGAQPSPPPPPTIQAEGQQAPPPVPTSVGSIGRSGTTGSASGSSSAPAAVDDVPLTIARRAGLFGSRDSLRIDVVRTLVADEQQPGIEEQQQISEPLAQRDPAPELLTVTYGFRDPRDVDPADTLATVGLVRREVPASGVRSEMQAGSDVTDDGGGDFVDSALPDSESFSSDASASPTGSLDEEAAQLRDTLLLAPEITRLEFQYFDGQEWFDEWDSVARGGLPRAIAVGLDLQLEEPRRIRESPAAEKTADSEISRPEEVPPAFRLVVWLPAADAKSTLGESGIETGSEADGQPIIGASASLQPGGLP